MTNTQVDLFEDFFNKPIPKQSPRKPSTIARSSISTSDPFTEFTSQPQPSQVIVEEEEEEDYAPAATEMRKRLASDKQMNVIDINSDSDTGIPDTNTKESPQKGKGRKRPTENDEVIAAAKERKRVAMEQSKLAAEELANAMKEVEGLRNLGTIETFSLDLDAPRNNREEERSARWNPLWNGRKNFKRFRKAKQSVSIGIGRHMIPLVEYKGRNAASQG
jgi:hypothetical protein